MVQKSFLSLLEYDVKMNPSHFKPSLANSIIEISEGQGTPAEKNAKV
jgi:hypothetical protein